MVSPMLLATKGKRSPIRELSEYGAAQAAIVGRENVFDFSLGNPSTPAPPEVNEAIRYLIDNEDPVELHGYSSNQGLDSCRQAIADSLNRRFGRQLTKKNIMMVMGASTGLHIISIALHIDRDSEIVAIAPFFPAYRQMAVCGGNKLVVVPPDTKNFQIDFCALEKLLNPHTQAIIVNSPNNPAGTIYSEETLKRLADLLTRKSEEFGHAIYIICDEPYRELVYTDEVVPYVPAIYKNTIVCYSYSKSLSLAGERIGYIATDNDIDGFDDVWMALRGASGYAANVCAPVLFQKVVERCVDVQPNTDDYVYNRNVLLEAFTKMGYHFAPPSGAFYLFFEAPFGLSAQEFSDMAKKYNVLVVPADGFGCPNWLRLSFCVSRRTVENALPLFEKLYAEAKERTSKE